MSEDQVSSAPIVSPEDEILHAAVSGINLTTSPVPFVFRQVMVLSVPESAVDGSYFVGTLDPFHSPDLISRFARHTMVQLVDGSLSVDPLVADVNVGIRMYPSSLLSSQAVTGAALFNDGYVSTAHFYSKLTVAQDFNFDLVFPPEAYSKLVYGVSSLAPSPGFIVGVQRVSRGGSTISWKAFDLRVTFTFNCLVRGYGVTLV